jgi:hypothetical protein
VSALLGPAALCGETGNADGAGWARFAERTQDFGTELLPLNARPFCDYRGPDPGRNPDVRHHGPMLNDPRFVGRRNDRGDELRRLHAAVDHGRANFGVRDQVDLAHRGERKA